MQILTISCKKKSQISSMYLKRKLWISSIGRWKNIADIVSRCLKIFFNFPDQSLIKIASFVNHLRQKLVNFFYHSRQKKITHFCNRSFINIMNFANQSRQKNRKFLQSVVKKYGQIYESVVEKIVNFVNYSFKKYADFDNWLCWKKKMQIFSVSCRKVAKIVDKSREISQKSSIVLWWNYEFRKFAGEKKNQHWKLRQLLEIEIANFINVS